MPTKKYQQGPLAALRLAKQLDQQQAATVIGLSSRYNYAHIERGAIMASTIQMQRMVQDGWGSPREVLTACTLTFERGPVIRRHRVRLAKVRGEAPVRRQAMA